MKLSRAGFTIVEGLFSMALVGLASVASIQLSTTLSRQVQFTSEKADQTKIVNDLILSIQNNPRRFMVNFRPTAGDQIDDSLLPPSNLPFGFGRGFITSAENCGSGDQKKLCVGRFGLTIQPKEGYRGLLVAQVRIRLDSSSSVQDFIFLVPEM